MNKNKEKVPKIRFPGFTEPWEQRKVGEWGTFYYGHSCPKWSVTEDATTPCIRYGELYTKFGAKIDKVFSYTNMPTDKLRFSKGTEVLIPRVGEDPMDYNHCTWLSIPGVAIGEMISVYNTEQNPLFTATMFNATLQKEFASRVEGGSVTNLYFEKLKNIDVWFPSLVEQEKIAAYFEQFDNLITLHQRKLNHLKDKKKGLLQKMFPKNGELVPELRFPEFTDPWEQRKLGDMCDEFKSGSSILAKDICEQGEYPVYGGNGLRGYTATYNHDGIYALIGRQGALCGNMNKVYGKAYFTEHAVAVKANKNNNTDFLFFLLDKMNLRQYSGQSAQPGLAVNKLIELITLVPNCSEQKLIGIFFNKLDNLITLHQRKLDHLKEQKKALLQQMFI